MRNVSVILLICLVAGGSPVIAQAQAQEKAAERKGIKIDEALFENTTLNPNLFRSLLQDVLDDTDMLEEAVFKVIGFANYSQSKSAYHHEIASVGGSLSFEISDGLFMIRILTKAEHEEVTRALADDLPNDLKSKQIFTITKVTNDCISAERGTTRLTIPADRILYFQQGLAPFFR